MPNSIDEKLFAHINNDAFLLGSAELEGNSFIHTVGFLEEFFQKYVKQTPNIPGDVLQLMTACRELKNIELELLQANGLANSNLDGARSIIDQTSQTLHERIQALKPNEYLLIPGGYRYQDGGHAIVYQMRKDANGNLLFCVHNSGNGLEYHEVKSDKGKDLYCSVYTYQIPAAQVANSNFVPFIAELLTASCHLVHKRERITPQYLYEELFPKLHHMKGKRVTNTDPQDTWYSDAQLSGTCSQKSLHRLLKSRFKNVDDYRQFIYRFKAYSLDEYIKVLRSNQTIQNPKYQSQVQKAIKHQLRLLNLKKQHAPDEDLFHLAIKQSELKKLTGYLSELRQAKIHYQPKVLSNPVQSHINTNHTIQLATPQAIAESTLPNYVQPTQSEILHLSGGSSLFSELDNLLMTCNTLASQGLYQALFNQLENFFTQLPLPSNRVDEPLHAFYRAIDSEQKSLQFYERMQSLQALYSKSCDVLLNQHDVLPRMVLVRLSMFAVIGHVNTHFPLVSRYDSNYYDYIKGLVYGFTRTNPDAVYLATNSPQLDERYQVIRQLYEYTHLHEIAPRETVPYYQCIINSEPDLQIELESLYQQAYQHDKSEFHEKIREKQFTSLFYFTEHLNELRTNKRFEKLIIKFDAQAKLEQLYGFVPQRVTTNDVTLTQLNSFQLKLQKKDASKDDFITTKKETLADHGYALRYTNRLTQAKYAIQDTAAAYALGFDINDWNSETQGKRPDNETQLVPAAFAKNTTGDFSQQLIDQETIASRELFHLRRNASTQIALTLDYFIQHLDKTSQHDIQVYIEANLFQPGLLLRQLSKNPTQFFQQFDAFIKKGLHYTEKKGQSTQHSLFFIRLMVLVNQYAAKQNPFLYSQRLQETVTEINNQLQLQNDPNVAATLHRCRFLSLMTLNDTGNQQTLISWFHMQSSQNVEEKCDRDSLFHYQHVGYEFVSSLQDKKREDLTSEVLVSILASMDLPMNTSKLTTQGAYPLYSFFEGNSLRYTMNIQQGLIYNQDGWALHSAPLNIRSHPMSKKFGLDRDSSCFVSPDGQNYLLQKPPTTMRFIKKENSFIIQKKWLTPSGETQWYEFTPLSVQQGQYYLQEFYSSRHQLPVLFQERETLIWQNVVSRDLLVSNSENKVQYYGTQDAINAQIYSSGTQKMLLHTDSWIHQRLNAFENQLMVTAQSDGQSTSIQLPRYGITFQVDEAKPNVIQWIYDGETYELTSNEDSLGTDIAHLTFHHGNKHICMLPIQPFLNSQERSEHSEYYRLYQDTSAKILQKYNETNKCIQYTNNEQFLCYAMEKGEPIPNTPAEALYLCYVYLGSNQVEKAWATLEKCNHPLGGLSGTEEELRYLHWIFNKLPHKLDEKEKDSTILNPEFVSCKLKALALLTKFNASDKRITFHTPQSEPSTVNAAFERSQQAEIKKFYDTLNQTIYTTYTELQKRRHELDAQYTLSDQEAKSLLDYYHYHVLRQAGQPVAIGALGYEWVQLQLNILKHEAIQLELKSKLTSSTPYEQRRQKEIAAFLNQHKGIASNISHLQARAMTLIYPFYDSIRTNHLSTQCQDLIRHFNPRDKALISNQLTQEKAIAILSLRTSEEEFLMHFNDYMIIATTPDHPLQAQLSSFVQSTLYASRHTGLYEQTKNIPLFSNVLYRLIETHKPLPTGITHIKEIFQYSRQLPSPPLMVLEQQNSTDELLSSAEALWNTLPIPRASKRPEEVKISSQWKPISHWLDAIFIKNKEAWQTIERQLRQEKTGDAVSHDEKQAGQIRFEALKQLNALAVNLFQKPDRITFIQTHTQEELVRIEDLLQIQKNALLTLAQEGPDSPELKTRWDIEIASGQRKELDLNQLLTLYFRADITQYALETGLSEDKINQLHSQIAQYVQQEIQYQQYQRINTQIIAFNQASIDEKEQASFLLCQALFTENIVDPLTAPELSLFQYHEKILLRPKQQAVLKRLLTTDSKGQYPEVVEKIEMGGGKSKVILPAAAKLKATGNNLVVIEVPKSLLHTNYVDLKATSHHLFNQDAFLFEFDRNSDCSSKRLEQLYNQLTEAAFNKQYMVTTGEAVQSMGLKYLELIMNRPKVDKLDAQQKNATLSEWKQQVLWAERIAMLFKHRGDVIIDEAHQGLLLKNKLNYTMGESRPLPKAILKHSIQLYQFFKHVVISKNPVETLERYIINRKEINQTLLDKLVDELIHNQYSPLHAELREWKKTIPTIEQLIKDYLHGKGTEVPECILKASPEIKLKMAFYKEQTSNLLNITCNKEQGVDYGPSKQCHAAPEQAMVAIPYLANDVPKEGSLFGNELASINYTIQSAMIKGISQDLVKKVLNTWLIQAQQEHRETPSLAFDDTPTAQLFSMLNNTTMRLSQVHLDDAKQLAALHQVLGHHPDFIYNVLQSHIIPQIKTNECVLTSDAYNHVDLYHTRQAITGTPWNYTTFHPRLNYAKDAAIGTDGYALRCIQEKKPAIHGVDFVNTTQFVEALLQRYQAKDEVRAIIDVAASFKGVDNLSVATALANYIQNNSVRFNHPQTIRYVLYFNEDSQLTALPIHDNGKGRTPIVIGSSDPDVINAKLDCKPSERFTYYDQSHTVGTDIKQSPQSKALVLTNKDTHLQDFLQGSMRMRDLLERKQSIDIVVPSKLAHQSFESLTQDMEASELTQLQEDNFNAALAKINNVLRDNVIQRMFFIQDDVDPASAKHDFYTIVQQYFIEEIDDDFFNQYGLLNEEQDTENLLTTYKTTQLTKWKELMALTNQTISSEELQEVTDSIQEIITAACQEGICKKKQSSRKTNYSSHVDVQQAQRAQVSVNLLATHQTQLEKSDPTCRSEPYHPWYSSGIKFLTLEEICKHSGDNNNLQFSDAIQASNNFYQTYQGQTSFVGMSLKPVHALLFEKINGILRCTLLSQTEYEELEQTRTVDESSWISTTQHTVLSGTPPPDIQDSLEYQSIIEQVRFFNGEFNLIKAENDLFWLNDPKQLEFFTQYLKPCRETQEDDLAYFNSMLLVHRKILQTIADSPDVDHRHTNWLALFPNCKEEDIPEYHQLANAFYEANQQSETHFINASELIEQFHLSIKTRYCLFNYIEKLNAIYALNLLSTTMKPEDMDDSDIKNELLAAANEEKLSLHHVNTITDSIKPLVERLETNRNKSLSTEELKRLQENNWVQCIKPAVDLEPLEQKGLSCKIVASVKALQLIEPKLSDFPVYKTGKKGIISARALAKQSGSTFGELYSNNMIDDWLTLIKKTKKTAFRHQTHVFHDEEEYIASIQKNMDNQQPVVVFFDVEPETGLPNPGTPSDASIPEHEHAAVVVGSATLNNEQCFILAHWGNFYVASAKDLARSSARLEKERTPELRYKLKIKGEKTPQWLLWNELVAKCKQYGIDISEEDQTTIESGSLCTIGPMSIEKKAAKNIYKGGLRLTTIAFQESEALALKRVGEKAQAAAEIAREKIKIAKKTAKMREVLYTKLKKTITTHFPLPLVREEAGERAWRITKPPSSPALLPLAGERSESKRAYFNTKDIEQLVAAIATDTSKSQRITDIALRVAITKNCIDDIHSENDLYYIATLYDARFILDKIAKHPQCNIKTMGLILNSTTSIEIISFMLNKHPELLVSTYCSDRTIQLILQYNTPDPFILSLILSHLSDLNASSATLFELVEQITYLQIMGKSAFDPSLYINIIQQKNVSTELFDKITSYTNHDDILRAIKQVDPSYVVNTRLNPHQSLISLNEFAAQTSSDCILNCLMNDLSLNASTLDDIPGLIASIANNPNKTDYNMFLALLRHKDCPEHVLNLLSKYPPDPHVLAIISTHPNTAQAIPEILTIISTHPNANQTMLKDVLDQTIYFSLWRKMPYPLEDIVLNIIKHKNTNDSMLRHIAAYISNNDVLNAIKEIDQEALETESTLENPLISLAKQTASQHCLYYMTYNHPHDIQLNQAIAANRDCSDEILSLMLEYNAINERTLECIISHPNASYETIIQALRHLSCTPVAMTIILNRFPEDIHIIKHITNHPKVSGELLLELVERIAYYKFQSQIDVRVPMYIDIIENFNLNVRYLDYKQLLENILLYSSDEEIINMVKERGKEFAISLPSDEPVSDRLTFAQKTSSTYCLQSLLSRLTGESKMYQQKLVENIINNPHCTNRIKISIIQQYSDNPTILKAILKTTDYSPIAEIIKDNMMSALTQSDNHEFIDVLMDAIAFDWTLRDPLINSPISKRENFGVPEWFSK